MSNERAPFQVLVFPYHISMTIFQIEYALFRRADLNVWQGIAGGGDNDETPIEAAQRETMEEGGTYFDKFIQLDSKSTIPVEFVVGNFLWVDEIYVIPEHCFGVEVKEKRIVVSKEHTNCIWVSFEKAIELLEWDSNKNALWELNKRILRQGLNCV